MKMPEIGLGTWQMDGPDTPDIVTRALELGYRHVDTAQRYANEAEVGAGIRASSVPREQVFVVTKIQPDRFADGTSLDSAQESLEKLGLDYVDLMLCHWPPRTVETEAVVDALMAVRNAGLAKSIGISNSNVSQMERAAAHGPVLTNQVEFHPMLDQSRLLEVARRTGMSLTGYMAIIRGQALTLPGVQRVSRETGRNAAAVTLRWVIQQGVAALCKSSNSDRLAANLEAMEFELTDEQMALISAHTAQNLRITIAPDLAPNWDE